VNPNLETSVRRIADPLAMHPPSPETPAGSLRTLRARDCRSLPCLWYSYSSAISS